jgi:hypothetical protein
VSEYAREVKVEIVSISKIERDLLREYNREMRSLIDRLLEAVKNSPGSVSQEIYGCCADGMKLLVEQDMRGLVRPRSPG